MANLELKRKAAEDEFLHWNSLPVELKTMCVERMDVESRMNLAETCRTERSIVEKVKLELEYLLVDNDYDYRVMVCGKDYSYYIDRTIDDNYGFRDKTEYAEVTKLIFYVLKHAEIEKMKVNLNRWTQLDFEKMLEKCDAIRVKSLKIGMKKNTYSSVDLCKIIKSCAPGVHTIKVHGDYRIRVGKIINLPNVLNAKSVYFKNECYENTLCQVLKKWEKTNPPIGTTFSTLTTDAMLDIFKATFHDKSIPSPEPYHSYRMRSRNPDKHFLLYNEYQLIVIPADLDFNKEDGWERFEAICQ